MSDIFREVEEDVRRERLEKIWKTYGDYIIALAAAIVLGVVGFVGWQRYVAAQRDKASVAFIAAQHVANPGDAAAAFAALAKTAPDGYGVLSRLEQANSLLAQGQRDQAVTLYKDIANSDNSAVGAVARLRAGWALADTASRQDLNTLLAPLETPGNAWREMAMEVLAYSDYRSQDFKKAAGEFQALADDNQAPDLVRERSRAFAAFLQGNHGADFGTVPPPAPAPPAPPDASMPPGMPMPPATP